MLSASDGARTRSVTCSAHLDRCIAACPAGFPAADDKALPPAHRGCLAAPGAVEAPAALQVFEQGDAEPAVGGAGRNDPRTGGQRRAAAEPEPVMLALAEQAFGLAHE